MSTMSLNFGVYIRNWPRIDLQPLKFNFELYSWKFRRGGGGGAGAVSEKNRNSRYQYQAQNPV